LTGGNGIAGTADVPAALLKNTPISGAAAMELNTGELFWFHNGMVIGPGLLEAVGEQIHRLGAFRAPDQKAGRGSADSANYPKHIFHRVPPFGILLWRLDAVKGEGVLLFATEISRARQERLHFCVWIPFASVVRLVSGLVLRRRRW